MENRRNLLVALATIICLAFWASNNDTSSNVIVKESKVHSTNKVAHTHSMEVVKVKAQVVERASEELERRAFKQQRDLLLKNVQQYEESIKSKLTRVSERKVELRLLELDVVMSHSPNRISFIKDLLSMEDSSRRAKTEGTVPLSVFKQFALERSFQLIRSIADVELPEFQSVMVETIKKSTYTTHIIESISLLHETSYYALSDEIEWVKENKSEHQTTMIMQVLKSRDVI